MSKSDLEAILAFNLRIFGQDLPEPEREARFHPVRRWLMDFSWRAPEGSDLAGVCVEVDGGSWAPYGGRHNQDPDRWKISEAAALGWVILRFSGAMLENDPERCVALIRQALARAGLLQQGEAHGP